jgi:hypothetical protein
MKMGGNLYLQVYIVLPNRAGNDFVAHLITLAHVQDTLLAQIGGARCRGRSMSTISKQTLQANDAHTTRVG